VGSGENLNEHILGQRWPEASVRLEMLREAVELIRQFWKGGNQSWSGRHFTVENARVYSLPSPPPPIHVSGFGPAATMLAAQIGDGYVNTSPEADAVDRFRAAGGAGPAIACPKCCWAPDEATARATVHRLWPNSGLPGQLAQELATPMLFEQATELVTEDQAVGSVPCGPDPEAHAASLQAYIDAGYDQIYIQQIGPDQERFLTFYRDEVLPHLA
jgi:G6PDH family F420-dependent oxidoreductase